MPSRRLPHNKIPMLVNGMVRIIKINVKRVVEDGNGFLKRNAMFVEVARSLFLIPLITHVTEYNIGSYERVFDEALTDTSE